MKRSLLVGSACGIIAGIFMAGTLALSQSTGNGSPGLPIAPASGGTGSASNTGTLNWTGNLTFSDTTNTTMTLPGASTTLAGLSTNQTFSGTDTFSNNIVGPGINGPGNVSIINLTQFGTGIDGFANFQVGNSLNSLTALVAIGAFGSVTNSSSTTVGLSFPFTINQTSTAATSVIRIDPVLTAQGSGNQYAIEINPGDGTAVGFWDLAGNVKALTLNSKGSTVSTLPTCNAGAKGKRDYVTDATSPTFNATLAGSGAVFAPAICNGTNWVAG